MDICRAADIQATEEHGGTCRTFFMVPKESMRDETEGAYLEYVSEFELVPGTHLEPHTHDTHEFYYMLSGKATVQIGAERQDVSPGDLVHIPRNAPHSIWPKNEQQGFRALAFAVSFQSPGASYVPVSLPI